MAFDFPASPTEGQIFSPADGPVYFFKSPVWQVVSSVPGITTAETRNRIVNPAMQISQQNGDTSGSTDNYFPADQWKVAFSSTGTLACARINVATPRGSPKRIRTTIVTVDTSLAATEHLQVLQAIEGVRIADFRWGTAQAKQVVLRFGIRAPAGTFTARIGNYAGTRSYLKNFTIAVANVEQEVAIVIPGDTTGAWPVDNTGSMVFAVGLAAGSTYVAPAEGWNAGNYVQAPGASNGFATAGNDFDLFDVGLYLDPGNTGVPPPWQMPDEAEELQACMRYWQPSYVIFCSSVVNGQNYYGQGSIRVPMRVSPTITGVNITSNSFSTAVGGLICPSGAENVAIREQRTANAGTAGAVVMGQFHTQITLNARM